MSLKDRILSRIQEGFTSGELRGMDEKKHKELVKQQIELWAKSIKRPSADWVRETFVNSSVSRYGDGKHPEQWNTAGSYTILLKNEKEGVNLIFRITGGNYKRFQTMDRITTNRNQDDYVHEMVHVEGSTEFKVGDKWFSFDQRGISSSFYMGRYSKFENPESVSKLVKEQLKRVEEAKDRQTNAVKMPSPLDRFTRTATDIDKIKKDLSSGKDVRFNPAGMGTGYILSKKKVSGPLGGKASKDIEDFFGVGPLYLSSYDAD